MWQFFLNVICLVSGNSTNSMSIYILLGQSIYARKYIDIWHCSKIWLLCYALKLISVRMSGISLGQTNLVRHSPAFYISCFCQLVVYAYSISVFIDIGSDLAIKSMSQLSNRKRILFIDIVSIYSYVQDVHSIKDSLQIRIEALDRNQYSTV